MVIRLEHECVDDDVLARAAFHLEQRLVKGLGQRRIEEHRPSILDVRRRLAVADDDDLLVLSRIPREQPTSQHQPMLHIGPVHVLIHREMRQRCGLDLPRQVTEPNDVQRVARIRTTYQ